MSEPSFGSENVRGRQRVIASSIWWTAPVAFIGIPLLHVFVVPSPSSDSMPDRLALAMQCNVVAMLPYFAVNMKIMRSRFRGGAHNPLMHDESPALKVDCRVLQNHLEQLVAFVLVLMGLATVLPREHLQLLPIATAMFVVARLVYWRGYHRGGTLGRAPGVQLTLFTTLPLLLLAVALVLWHRIAA